MRCPQCDTLLRVVEEEAFSALLCDSCDGVFYPGKEFGKHLELVRTRSFKQLIEDSPAAQPAAGRARRKPSGPCPACGAKMKSKPVGFDSNIMLACTRCGGLWAKPGQIEDVARSIKVPRLRSIDQLPDDMLDRYAQGLLDEDRQNADFERATQFGKQELAWWALPIFNFMPMSAADDLRRISFATYGLMALNVMLLIFARSLFPEMALVPAEVTKGLRLHTLVTHQFAHGGILHLLYNMWFLRAFGDRVEDRLGPWWYLVVYLALGSVAGLAHAYMDPHSSVPCLGASGAISAIMGLYLVLFPTFMVRVVVLFRTVRVPAVLHLTIWFTVQVLAQSAQNIAVAAHLGGFLAGAWVGGVVRIWRLGHRSAR